MVDFDLVFGCLEYINFSYWIDFLLSAAGVEVFSRAWWKLVE